jgi:hypothetical protein
MKATEIYTIEEVNLLIKERDAWRARAAALERAIKRSLSGSCDTCKFDNDKKGSLICAECVGSYSKAHVSHNWQFDEARYMEG